MIVAHHDMYAIQPATQYVAAILTICTNIFKSRVFDHNILCVDDIDFIELRINRCRFFAPLV